MNAGMSSTMAAEMQEQPGILRALVGRRREFERLTGWLDQRPLGFVLIARGSSDNAAVYGRYLLELTCGRPAALAAPSVHTRYVHDADYSGYVAIAVSQSGRTPEVVSTLEQMGAAGARTIAITNDSSSDLAAVADHCLALEAGPELAVPATKTFTASLVALALVADALGSSPLGRDEWDRLLDAADAVVAEDGPALSLAARLADDDALLCLSRGLCLSAALETALKLKEAAGLRAEGGSTADLRHGSVAGYPATVPALLLSSSGALHGDALDAETWLTGRGHRVHVAADRAGVALPVPVVSEALAPVLLAIRGQQLALFSALTRKLDPDRPSGLLKVTPTR
jgi:glutamine---fructose-6-phosphate transaminase (isomerizing)